MQIPTRKQQQKALWQHFPSSSMTGVGHSSSCYGNGYTKNHCEYADLSAEDPQLPTRLLDVRSPAKLLPCHTEERERGKYIALSYKWGTVQTFSNNAGEREQIMQWVAASDLPKAFRDAIEVTQKLGVSFLWIDSFCT
jgi:hypothetical protein